MNILLMGKMVLLPKLFLRNTLLEAFILLLVLLRLVLFPGLFTKDTSKHESIVPYQKVRLHSQLVMIFLKDIGAVLDQESTLE